MWDRILAEHIYYETFRSAAQTHGWVPAIPKSGIEYLQTRFAAWMVMPCGDRFHRVAISRRGALAFLDHPNWRRELKLRELGGGETPDCLKLIDEITPVAATARGWDRRWLNRLPEDFEVLIQEAINKRRKRQTLRFAGRAGVSLTDPDAGGRQ